MEHHIVTLLHCLIGTGNNLLNRFCNVINKFMEKLSTAEIRLMCALANYNIIIARTVRTKEMFDAAPKGKKLKSLQVWLA